MTRRDRTLYAVGTPLWIAAGFMALVGMGASARGVAQFFVTLGVSLLFCSALFAGLWFAANRMAR